MKTSILLMVLAFLVVFFCAKSEENSVQTDENIIIDDTAETVTEDIDSIGNKPSETLEIVDIVESTKTQPEEPLGILYETGEGSSPILMVNKLDVPIISAWVDSSSGDISWGMEILGDQMLSPGDTLAVFVEPGVWNLKAGAMECDSDYCVFEAEVCSDGYLWVIISENDE